MTALSQNRKTPARLLLEERPVSVTRPGKEYVYIQEVLELPGQNVNTILNNVKNDWNQPKTY